MDARRDSLVVKHFGPIEEARVVFGDLTLLVGPQGTGKSIFLETLKLVIDRPHILDTFTRYNVVFNGDPGRFLDGYYGRGMARAISSRTQVQWCGESQELKSFVKNVARKVRYEQLFYIPAQRVVSLPKGVTQNFGQFDFGDPYILRSFSDTVHQLLQNEFGSKDLLFPVPNRLSSVLQTPISNHLFGGARLAIDATQNTKRMVLKVGKEHEGLPFLAWSAGQREFTPLLLGLYWLCPAGGKGSTGRRRSGSNAKEDFKWVVIEEAEMGLHPQGIATMLLLVLELLKRGYKVVMSTHSPVGLDMVWALRLLKANGGTSGDVRNLFMQPANGHMDLLARAALKADYRVVYFDRDGRTYDISSLDPNADSAFEAEWGGLSGFASQAGGVVSQVMNRKAMKTAKGEERA